MSETTNLRELAQFVGQSTLSSPDPAVHRRALKGIAARLDPKPIRRTVGELLGVVLTLSARTRRMGMPKASIDLDVFAPGGRRAVRLIVNGRR